MSSCWLCLVPCVRCGMWLCLVATQPPGMRPRAPHGYSELCNRPAHVCRSSLTCPHCRKQSNTFDPFLCISLPIPVRQTR